MKIAVINEISSADKNSQIMDALDGFGHEVINLGMKSKEEDHQLQYIHTGLLTALMLNTNRADFVIGGCGTGIGYLNAAVQYPGVFCGHALTPLDVWLFAQINGGNCLSLALNQGYGWAGDVNLKFMFEKLFSVEFGCGYPAERQAPQKKSREILEKISRQTHKSMGDILDSMDKDVLRTALNYPGVFEALMIDSIEDDHLKKSLKNVL